MAQPSKNVKHTKVRNFLKLTADIPGTSLAHLHTHMNQAIQI